MRTNGLLVHGPEVISRGVMASGARSLHGPVVHSLRGKGDGTAMTQRAFVARHAGRRGCRDVVIRLDHDAGVASAMAGLAGTLCHAGMVVGRRQPADVTVVTGIA